MLLLFGACRTQSTITPFVLRDSISITYKQGKEQPTPSQILCNPQRLAGDNYRSYEVATRYDGKPKSLPSGGGAKSVESVESVRDIKIRVDTVFVERWHTEVKVESESESESGKSKPAKPVKPAKLVFYKDCTWGFFILLLLIIGRIALRITKAIYLRR